MRYWKGETFDDDALNLAAGGHSIISRDVNYGRLSGDLTLRVGEMLEGSD